MTNPPGAMPPLPARECGPHTGHVATWTPQQMHDYAKAYAAPLIARVAELERQNEAQKDEWLSWEAKRAALEKDAGRYRWLRDMGATFQDEKEKNHHVCEWAMDAAIDAAIAAKD